MSQETNPNPKISPRTKRVLYAIGLGIVFAICTIVTEESTSNPVDTNSTVSTAR